MSPWNSYITLLQNMQWFSRCGSIVWSMLPLPIAFWFIYAAGSNFLSFPSSMASMAILFALAIVAMIMLSIMLVMIPQAVYALRELPDLTLPVKGN